MRFRKENFLGEIEVSKEGIVKGFLINLSNPQPIHAIDVFLDDIYINTILCNQPIKTEIEGRSVKIKTGFISSFSKTLIRTVKYISLKLTNTERVLFTAPLAEVIVDQSKIVGSVHYDGGVTFSGWVMDISDPSKVLEVTIKEKNKIVAIINADKPYTIGTDSFLHGFSYTISLNYLDGNTYEFSFTSYGYELDNSPIIVCAQPELLSEWIGRQKKFNETKKTFLIKFVQSMERIVQRHIDFNLYKQWKKLNTKVVIKNNFLNEIPKISLNQKNFNNIDKVISNSSGEYVLVIFNENIMINKYTSEFNYFIREAVKSGTTLVYGDADMVFRPSFDPDLFLEFDYLGDYILVKKAFLKQFLAKYGHIFDIHEFRTLLVLEAMDTGTIAHIPVPLGPKSDFLETPSFVKKRVEVINRWAAFKGLNFKVKPRKQNGLLKVVRTLRDEPFVSIIIPTRDKAEYLKKCIESIKKKSSYLRYEIIVIDNNSEERSTKEYLKRILKEGVRVLKYEEVFNFAKMMNQAVRIAKGEIICFLNNDTELISSDWLETALSFLAEDSIGIVGAKLIWPNEYVQHAGVVIGVSGLAYHVGNQWHRDERGYLNRNVVTGRWSAVTGACLFIKKELYMDVGGMDESTFPVNFNDTDLCLRVRNRGYDVVFSPDILLWHHESLSRGRDNLNYQKMRAFRESEEFRNRWGGYEDPYYNPNLSLSPFHPPFSGLAFPNRSRRIRIWRKK